MQDIYSDSSDVIQVAPTAHDTKSIPVWIKLLVLFLCLVGLVCGGGMLTLVYLVSMAPATYVYPEGKIPQRFLDVAEECGGLQSGENVEFFYSDGFADVKEGFCYVSDQKVAVFYPDDEPPLIVIPYREIKSVELERNESELVDSIITVHLEGDEVWIFVSSEMDRDVDFYEAIRSRIDE